MNTRLTARGHAVKNAAVSAFAFLSIVAFGVLVIYVGAAYFAQPFVEVPR